MTAKSYSTKSAAVAALKKQGLQLVPHIIRESPECFLPVFYPLTAEDRSDIVHRGFCVDNEVNAPWFPLIGQTVEHYKGKRYKVIAVGIETETNQVMVTYLPLYSCPHSSFHRWLHGHDEDGNMFGWMDPLPDGGRRFTPVRG